MRFSIIIIIFCTLTACAANCSPNQIPINVSKCDYVTNATLANLTNGGDCSDVMDGGQINYLSFQYCTMSQYFGLGTLILVISLFQAFILLGEVADVYFAPTMKELADTLGLSDTVAGVTFMAFGNGAPDISSSIDALTGSQPQLGLSALIGAGVFVPMVVSGAIAFFVPGAKIARRPYLRDIFFLFFSVAYLLFISMDGVISKPEAFSLWAIYFLYVLTVIFAECYKKRREALEAKRSTEAEQAQDPILNAFQMFSNDSLSNLYDPKQLSEDKLGGAPNLESSESYSKLFSEDDSGDEEEENSTCFMVWFNRFYFVLSIPAQVIMIGTTLTCPNFEGRLNVFLCLLHTLTSLPFAVWAFGLWKINVTLSGKSFSIIWVVLAFCVIPCCICCYLVVLHGKDWQPKGFIKIYLLLSSFVSSVAWIEMIADELVNLLAVLGLLLGISQTVLGITVLAWGNSLGDLVSDVSVARRGSPAMGIAAALGGPLLNILIGTGVSMTINTVKNDGSYAFPHDLTLTVLMCGLLGGLLLHLLLIPWMKFRLPKWFAYIAFAYYFLFCVGSVFIGVCTEP